MSYVPFSPQPKPTETRKKELAKIRRQEATRLQWLHAHCRKRDQACRVPGCETGAHLELAHLWTWKRARTRSQSPRERHTPKGACMLCMVHHHQEDANDLELVALTNDGADGPVAFFYRGVALGITPPVKD